LASPSEITNSELKDWTSAQEHRQLDKV
jgi:hypothetical protein